MIAFNLDKYLKNPSKKVVTRSGRKVRIICKNRISSLGPIVALVNESGEENLVSYDINGKFYKHNDSPLDLFFAPEKHEGWVNILKSSKGNNVINSDIFESKEDAEEAGGRCLGYIATAKIEWEE